MSDTQFLPMTPEEVAARGWNCVDVVFVTGDAYVDHPSFAMAILGRVLEAEGFRVAILSQPDWRSCEPWQTFGRPRLCFAVSAGNMDSMLNHYTANKKVRNDDAFSPGGVIGRRPDRATLAYCQRARQAFRGVPIIAGGVEASLRRLAHYDYWSERVRRSIIFDAKADMIVYGMGEKSLIEIVRRLDAGQSTADPRDIHGIAYRLGASEQLSKNKCSPAALGWEEKSKTTPEGGCATDVFPPASANGFNADDALVLPSYEEVSTDKSAFVRMTRMIHRETNPHNARRLVQYHGCEAVVVNPPAMPLSQAEMDRIYGLPFTRRPHPSYGRQRIPAYEVVKDSIQIMRGCFGGCTFCSLTAHQGRVIQSRGQESILAEIRRMAAEADFSGVISDLGGPTANMYQMNCCRPEVGSKCRRLSCLRPNRCKMLGTDHGPLVQMLKAARRVKNVKQVFVASGVRMDLARLSPDYMRELVQHHVGGLLKVAPEHVDPEVLRLMNKPPIEEFEEFGKAFRQSAASKEIYLAPYFMAGHPGSDLASMIALAQYLMQTGYRPDKVQDFIPLPMDIATCMYYTGVDPISGKSVYVPKGARERRWQRALLQYWKSENYADVREALHQAGRTDLIGKGPQCLIPSQPPTLSVKKKTHDPREKTSAGYRPHRKTGKRKEKETPRRHGGHEEE
jgi:uncharacterized radical SAM protein YgiQ